MSIPFVGISKKLENSQVNEKILVISILSVYSQMMTYKADKANCHGANMDYRTPTLKIYVILQAI